MEGLIGSYSVAGLFGAVIFGGAGLFAFLYGKKAAKPVFIAGGIILMAYPYFVRGTMPLYLVGGLICLGLFFLRKA